MRIVTLEEIQSIVTVPNAIAAVKAGFVAFSEGRVGQPEPMQLLFENTQGDLLGDCHAKAAQATGLPYFVIKVASGFYQNAEKGLPVNNGLVMVMSAETGAPIAILQDDGWLTQIRTACAGALAAGLKSVNADTRLGIIGTGTQALLQAQVISSHFGLSAISVYGRSEDKTRELCRRLKHDGLAAIAMTSARDLCQVSDVVVTTTPSTQPVISGNDLSGNLHIIAVGADSPGKIEIAPEVLEQADVIATDNHSQCLHHGDFGAAVRASLVAHDADVSFCDLLAGAGDTEQFANANLSVVDLTGLGVQDLALASMVVNELSLQS